MGAILSLAAAELSANPAKALADTDRENTKMLATTPSNTAILFLDLQDEIVRNSHTVSIEKLQKSAGALAKLAALHKLPVFLSAVPPGGPFMSSVTSALGSPALMKRTQTTAFADKELVATLETSKRRNLIISGVASEIVVQRTALDGLAAGYSVQVAVDACGGIDARTEDAAWRRILASGGTTTSVITFAAELAGDFTTELGSKTLGIMYESLGG
jgi:nicotinamidase-related amidase